LERGKNSFHGLVRSNPASGAHHYPVFFGRIVEILAWLPVARDKGRIFLKFNIA
jgi:hypothetical protein